MRLIDADALKKEVDNFPNCYNGWSDTYDKAYIIGAIEEQPSIDIVRCKDCKWRGEQTESGIPYYWCRLVGVGYEVPIEHYCSYGERKESE